MSEQPPASRTMRSDARANREALIWAARRLYAQRGGPVPLSAVAQEAGVGIGTLYRHFPTLHDLLVGVLGSVRDEIVAICQESLAAMKADPIAGWSQFASRVVALHLGAFIPQVIAGLDLAHLDADIEELRAQAFEAVTEVVEAAKRGGALRQDARADHVHLGLGVLSRPLPEQVEASHPQLTDWLVETFLRGLRPPPDLPEEQR